MAKVKPPRGAFINFPLGHQCGRPHDIDLQTRILKDTLDVLTKATTPGEIVDLLYVWYKPFDWDSRRSDLEEMYREEGVSVTRWLPDEMIAESKPINHLSSEAKTELREIDELPKASGRR